MSFFFFKARYTELVLVCVHVAGDLQYMVMKKNNNNNKSCVGTQRTFYTCFAVRVTLQLIIGQSILASSPVRD